MQSDLPDPDSVYGLSKLKRESYLSDIKNSMIIRTSWLYSNSGNEFLKNHSRGYDISERRNRDCFSIR
ncbi:MAG: sugar nucleotide-binding protein [Bacteroidales bacterium]|nr:sugar nucleotide-binding protein [Bacteroidales bacterium]